MAAALADPSKLAPPAGFDEILELLHDLLEGSPARGPAFDAAVTAFLLTVAVVYAVVLGGVALVYLYVVYTDRVEAAPLAPAALGRLFAQAVKLISALLLIFGAPLTGFLIHAAGGR